MRNFLVFTLVFLATGVSANAQDEAQTQKSWSVDTSVGAFTSYMWRGFRLYDGASIQPSITGTYDTGNGVVSANGWMHLTGDGHNQSERFTEFDGTLKYEYDFDAITVGVGHIWYTYSDYGDGATIPNSSEFFQTIAYNWNILTPTLTVYEDYQEYDNQFYELAISHEFGDVFGKDTAAVTPFASFGFSSNSKKVYDRNGLEEVTVGVSTALPFGPLSLNPVVNYTFKVDELTVNQFWAGMNLAYSF